MEVVHKCKSCSASYSSASNLRRHVKAAHRGIKYPCPKCDKVFSRTDNRSQHLKKEHPETVVKDSDGPAITKLKSVVVVPDGQEQPAAKRCHLEMTSATPSAHQQAAAQRGRNQAHFTSSRSSSLVSDTRQHRHPPVMLSQSTAPRRPQPTAVTFSYRDYRLFEPQLPSSRSQPGTTSSQQEMEKLRLQNQLLTQKLVDKDNYTSMQAGIIRTLREELCEAKQQLTAKIVEVARSSKPVESPPLLHKHEASLLDVTVPSQMARGTEQETAMMFDPLASSNTTTSARTSAVLDIGIQDIEDMLCQ
jgi:uncharacterized C2H2 Zn-finger protein